ncbi:hypothetical protein HYW19_01085 [Candidatus Woesearchaeota archaeon]|nr:hypothetical protein [Candidatus Woesearchaeota archaeon]
MIVSNVADNTLTMRLTNNFGVGVYVTSAEVTTDVTTAGECTAEIEQGADDAISAFPWESDSTITFRADCDSGDLLVDKEKIKFNVEMEYYPVSAGDDYTKIIFGEVFTTVQ